VHQPVQDFDIDERTRGDAAVSRRFVPHPAYLSSKMLRIDPRVKEYPSGTCRLDRMPT